GDELIRLRWPRSPGPVSIWRPPVRHKNDPRPTPRRLTMSATSSTSVQATKIPVIPHVLGGVAPYLSVAGANRAAEFYERAFGAKEVGGHPVDTSGRTMHIHLYINGGSLMLSDPFPEQGHPLQAPQAFTLHLQVDDVASWWDRALSAGCEVVLPLQVMFWG